MQTIWRLLLVLPVLVLLVTGTVVLLTLDSEPTVQSDLMLTREDIQRAKQIIDVNPEDLSSALKTLELTEKDLNIAANHLLDRHIDSATQVTLNHDGLNFKTSVKLNNRYLNRFLNVQFDVYKKNRHAAIKNFSIGRLAIPDAFAAKMIALTIRYSPLKKYYRLVSTHIEKIQVHPDKLTITYFLDHDAYQKARGLVSYQGDNATLSLYQRKLVEVINHHDRGWLLSLAEIMQPLFQLAYQRSTPDNAIEENKNVIFIVSAYVNKRQWQSLLPGYLPDLSAPLLPVYMYKRTDMAQHFMGSAALASLGSSYLANMLGLKKELHDAHGGGSGFSFIDLAADRAGMYFGKMATSSPANARKIQKAMSNIDGYSAFMPDVRDLPEKIEAKELAKQYDSINSPAAQAILKQIDTRIEACPIYDEI